MKILFVLENFYPNIGGVETLFKTLCEELAARGHSVGVITHRLNPELPAEETRNGVRIHRINVPNRYLFTFFSLPAIFKAAKGFDYIHTTSYNAALPAFIAGRLRKKKILITFHEVWGRLWFQLPFIGWISKTGHFLFEQLILKLPFDRFIAVSDSTASRLQASGIRRDRINRIYNGIDYSAFETISHPQQADRPFTYTYFGRLGISKGLDILLRATAILKKDLPQAQLQLIIPEEPVKLFRKLQRMIAALNLESHIRMRHSLSREDLHQALASSDCVVIPSYSEGFCFSAVEAIALGIPVISSDRAALKEVVSGKFIKLTALNAMVLAEALLKGSRGEWTESKIIRFELADQLTQYLKLYESL